MTLQPFEPAFPPVDDVDPAATWAACGGSWLTGRPGGPHLPAPPDTTRVLTAAARRFAALTGELGRPVSVDGPALVGERAAHAGFKRNGAITVGGAGRLLRAGDGWIAASLPRPEDVDLIPAWLGCEASAADPWTAVERAVAERTAVEIVEQAALLGIPCSALGEVPHDAPAVLVERAGSVAGAAHLDPADDVSFDGVSTAAEADPPTTSLDRLIVADLSSLWAGPLCADLLGRAGARVIKVESTSRPDGARLGPPTFFELLHGGHEAVAVDFATPVGRETLAALLAKADVVIEASRPRALEQLGIDARSLIVDGPRVWLSITAYGREGAARQRVGFGDDAAVAGGLVSRDEQGPCFCGDAIADPSTGLLAAVTVVELLAAGGRWLVDVALSRVARRLAGGPRSDDHGGELDGQRSPTPTPSSPAPAPPRSRTPRGRAPAIGEHTDAVLAELGIAPATS